MAQPHHSDIPVLDSTSAPPNLFDGTTRLYISFVSPFAQRVWSARNYKGLDQIEVIAINLGDKPSWYVEVYPVGKVPALEHDGKVIGESLDILEYLDENFGGPSLFPQDSAKRDAVKELLKFSEEFLAQALKLLKNKEATKTDLEQDLCPVFDQLEAALAKYEDEGPFFLGQFGGVDLAYAPLFERVVPVLTDIFNYNLYDGRPRLTKWWKAMNTVEAYTITKSDPATHLQRMKRLMGR